MLVIKKNRWDKRAEIGNGDGMVTGHTLGLVVEVQNLWFVVLGQHESWHFGTIICLHVGHCEC